MKNYEIIIYLLGCGNITTVSAIFINELCRNMQGFKQYTSDIVNIDRNESLIKIANCSEKRIRKMCNKMLQSSDTIPGSIVLFMTWIRNILYNTVLPLPVFASEHLTLSNYYSSIYSAYMQFNTINPINVIHYFVIINNIIMLAEKTPIFKIINIYLQCKRNNMNELACNLINMTAVATNSIMEINEMRRCVGSNFIKWTRNYMKMPICKNEVSIKSGHTFNTIIDNTVLISNVSINWHEPDTLRKLINNKLIDHKTHISMYEFISKIQPENIPTNEICGICLLTDKNPISILNTNTLQIESDIITNGGKLHYLYELGLIIFIKNVCVINLYTARFHLLNNKIEDIERGMLYIIQKLRMASSPYIYLSYNRNPSSVAVNICLYIGLCRNVNVIIKVAKFILDICTSSHNMHTHIALYHMLLAYKLLSQYSIKVDNCHKIKIAELINNVTYDSSQILEWLPMHKYNPKYLQMREYTTKQHRHKRNIPSRPFTRSLVENTKRTYNTMLLE